MILSQTKLIKLIHKKKALHKLSSHTMNSLFMKSSGTAEMFGLPFFTFQHLNGLGNLGHEEQASFLNPLASTMEETRTTF